MLNIEDYNTQLFAQVMLIVIPGWTDELRIEKCQEVVVKKLMIGKPQSEEKRESCGGGGEKKKLETQKRQSMFCAPSPPRQGHLLGKLCTFTFTLVRNTCDSIYTLNKRINCLLDQWHRFILAAYRVSGIDPQERGESLVMKTSGFSDLAASLQKPACIQAMQEKDLLRRSLKLALIDPASLTPPYLWPPKHHKDKCSYSPRPHTNCLCYKCCPGCHTAG